MINKNDISRIWMTDTAIWLQLTDNRKASELFADYPRLAKASADQRKNFIVSHFGLHWPELDEDLSFGVFSTSGHEGEPPQSSVIAHNIIFTTDLDAITGLSLFCSASEASRMKKFF